MTTIDDFRFGYRWLSNFHAAEIIYEGEIYPSTEHAYQAAKTEDQKLRELMSVQPSPKFAKRLGKLLPLRNDWEFVKIDVMREVCLYKFSQHPDLKQKLLDTGDAELIEGNTWGDQFWGVCRGVGENHLGKILMEIREYLKT